MSNSDNVKNRAAYTREGRKQLFAVLQSARGSTGEILIVICEGDNFFWKSMFVLFAQCESELVFCLVTAENFNFVIYLPFLLGV